MLAAGGIPQTEEWNASLVMYSYKDDFSIWETTRAWALARAQYEYFSDPANRYINGEVINVYKSDTQLNQSQVNVSLGNLPADLRSLGIQKGDLMYFYNSVEGVHHATVISSVTDTEIKYSGNTSNRFDQRLSDTLKKGSDAGVFIVRLNSKVLGDKD